MLVIRSTQAWSPEPYRGELPPPLCFTTPAGDPVNQPPIARSGAQAFTPRVPKKMMDPLDRSTWQKDYRFT